MTEGNGGINYSVKELLARIEVKLDLLSTQVQQKADASQVGAAQQQVNRRLDKLELESASQEAVGRYRKWLVATAIPALMGAGYAVAQILELGQT